MSGRISISVHLALGLVAQGKTLSYAARATGCNLRSLRRALRRQESLRPPLTRHEGTEGSIRVTDCGP